MHRLTVVQSTTTASGSDADAESAQVKPVTRRCGQPVEGAARSSSRRIRRPARSRYEKFARRFSFSPCRTSAGGIVEMRSELTQSAAGGEPAAAAAESVKFVRRR